VIDRTIVSDLVYQVWSLTQKGELQHTKQYSLYINKREENLQMKFFFTCSNIYSSIISACIYQSSISRSRWARSDDQNTLYFNVIYKSTCLETTSPRWNHLWTIQARLPWWPPFSQHVSWQCCNPLDIPSSMVEILLFNSVFHDKVTPVSVSTLKPLLGAIGVFPLEPRASLKISFCI